MIANYRIIEISDVTVNTVIGKVQFSVNKEQGKLNVSVNGTRFQNVSSEGNSGQLTDWETTRVCGKTFVAVKTEEISISLRYKANTTTTTRKTVSYQWNRTLRSI